MKHEKVFKREDGSAIKITVSLYVELMKNEFYWNYQIEMRSPGKRKYRPVKVVGEPFYFSDEIFETQNELYNLIKPKKYV
jgi:hypothetical protein